MIKSEPYLRIPVTEDLATAVCGYYDDVSTHALDIDHAAISADGEMLLITGKLIMPDGIASMEGVIKIPIKGPYTMGTNITTIAKYLMQVQMDRMMAAFKILEGTVLDFGKE